MEVSVFKVLTATHKPMHTTVKLFSLLVHVLFKKLIVAIELPQIVFEFFVGYFRHILQVSESPL